MRDENIQYPTENVQDQSTLADEYSVLNIEYSINKKALQKEGFFENLCVLINRLIVGQC